MKDWCHSLVSNCILKPRPYCWASCVPEVHWCTDYVCYSPCWRVRVTHQALCLSGHFIKDDRQQEIKDSREVNSELCWHTCQSKTPVRVMCYIILVRSDSLLEPALGGPDRNCRFWHFHIHFATISTDPVFFSQLHHCSVTQKYFWANINYAPLKKIKKASFCVAN